MEFPIDKPTQQEQEIVYAFDKQYQQPDPFYPHNKVIGSPIPTENIFFSHSDHLGFAYYGLG